MSRAVIVIPVSGRLPHSDYPHGRTTAKLRSLCHCAKSRLTRSNIYGSESTQFKCPHSPGRLLSLMFKERLPPAAQFTLRVGPTQSHLPTNCSYVNNSCAWTAMSASFLMASKSLFPYHPATLSN
jgi:hypothetical protein